jgi:hypothetical protein
VPSLQVLSLSRVRPGRNRRRRGGAVLTHREPPGAVLRNLNPAPCTLSEWLPIAVSHRRPATQEEHHAPPAS